MAKPLTRHRKCCVLWHQDQPPCSTKTQRALAWPELSNMATFFTIRWPTSQMPATGRARTPH